jgi:hypothetical protein
MFVPADYPGEIVVSGEHVLSDICTAKVTPIPNSMSIEFVGTVLATWDTSISIIGYGCSVPAAPGYKIGTEFCTRLQSNARSSTIRELRALLWWQLAQNAFLSCKQATVRAR